VIFRAARVTTAELARVTGWHVRPEGLCREERCIPFASDGDTVDLDAVAQAIGAPLVHDRDHGLWALGAEAGGRALASATAPDFELPDVAGRPFRLSSLRGQKVVLVAWASW
jgi:AhpC/TSA family protein